MGIAAATCPAQRQFHGGTRLAFASRIRRTLVEYHDYVRAQLALYLHRLLGPEKHPVAIDRRTEGHALFGNLAQGPEAEHLETTGISQNRPLPVHKIM